ncbi:MAG: Na+/H+ antiporter NhaC family protein [Pirellulaceae bacterium]
MHPYGLLSLLPPVVAIALAIATRRVIPSLLLGVFVGAVVMAWNQLAGPAGESHLREQIVWTLPVAVGETIETHLWQTLVDEDKLRVFAFTLLMGAMVGIINRAGGMRGLVDALAPLARSRRGGQLVTWALGLLIFFDDYANTLLLGSTLRPLCDRLRISREKLAYLVDSTAAPVAGLAVVSTWVAGEIGFIQDGLDKLPATESYRAFALFLESIAYRFYVLWALLMVMLIAAFGRDFGPMLQAERRAWRREPAADQGSARGATSEVEASDDHAEDAHEQASHWIYAVAPIVVTVAVIMVALYETGRAALDPNKPATWMDVLGGANAYSSLVWGALAGVFVAAALVGGRRLLNVDQITAAAARGARLMVPALAILWLAAALSTMTRGVVGDDGSFPEAAHRMYTGEYMGTLLAGNLPAWVLPTVVFVLSSVVAFSTGTSWGTMGIIMPLAIPLVAGTLDTGGGVEASDPILLSSIGGVLAGAIFGDHCSPISDTTVLSSQASGCDHVAHVWTQMPYALTVGGLSIVCGTLPVGLGAPVWILLPVGTAALVLIVWVFGRGVEPK